MQDAPQISDKKIDIIDAYIIEFYHAYNNLRWGFCCNVAKKQVVKKSTNIRSSWFYLLSMKRFITASCSKGINCHPAIFNF